MIRQQQAQLQQIQQHAGLTSSTSTGAVDDSTPTSERSFSFPSVPGNLPMTVTNPRPRSPVPRSSMELSRQSSRRSRTPSRTGSPALRPLSAGLQAQGDEWLLSGGSQGSRDESAFYQAETQMLTRENQMLRLRIRELGTSLFVSNWICVLTTGRTADQRGKLSNCEYSRHAIKFNKSPNRHRTYSGDFRRSGHGSREQRLRGFDLPEWLHDTSVSNRAWRWEHRLLFDQAGVGSRSNWAFHVSYPRAFSAPIAAATLRRLFS